MTTGTGGTIGVVLVPGAGLGGWIWRDAAPLVHAPTLAVELPGRDLDPKARHALGLGDYAAHVEEQVRSWDVERVVVVAHSLGGVVAQAAAHLLGVRVAGFVAVAAAVPRHGGSFLSCLPWPRRLVLHVLLRAAGTRPPASAIRKGLANDLPPELAAEVVERFTPESRRVYVDRAGVGVPAVPRRYVRTTDDAELGPALQDRMIANLGTDDVVAIGSGHLPMLSRPRALAEVLDGFVAGLARP